MKAIRKTGQHALPVVKNNTPQGYDIYPVHTLNDGEIAQGYDTLARALAGSSCIVIDGYVGILFEHVRGQLEQALAQLNVRTRWIAVADAMLPPAVLAQRLAPSLGGDDPVFGKLCTLQMADFFDPVKLKALVHHAPDAIPVYYGSGAALVPVTGTLVFFDISKNEIQFRARAGAITNLGAAAAQDAKTMYKRFYFADWPVLNRHVESLKERIDFFADGQRAETITWMQGNAWRAALKGLARRPIRVRPWFEPGAWGGTWIKDRIEGLARDVVNYAWSFELIVPENGILLESAGVLMECSFDTLMFLAGASVLGVDHDTYGNLFPIRFDFLDTFNGGNLSVQCHPQLAYMQRNFGEHITQEETYYILDRQHDACVYLGFQEGVTQQAFGQALAQSHANKEPIAIEKFVQRFPADKHALFLIPPGTVHASGKDTLVLEISSTPYIYTFKMYDWLRLDLDGQPRPLNIARGLENLVFSRAGDSVRNELIATPQLLEYNDAYALYHLPTHREHLYDVHRYVIHTEVTIPTGNKAHVLSLVEGDHIDVMVDGIRYTYAYAETFVIPAGAGAYTIRNTGAAVAMVVKAFIK